MTQIKAQYGFPVFVKETSTNYLLKAEKIHVSDIWALWHYIIKSEKRRFPGTTDYPFLLSVLEQAQYFYEAAYLAPIKSKPLLYYYSFLNIAKAAIALTKSDFSTLNLEFNHGVDSCPISNNVQLSDCYVTVKSLTSSEGIPQKISVAYEVAQLFGDNLEFRHPNPVKHDNGPWKIGVISLLKSCIGIHRSVSETFKTKESFVHIELPIIEKEGKHLVYKGRISSTSEERSRLTAAGYSMEEIDHKWYLKEDYNMPTASLSRHIFYQFSRVISSKGLWT